MPVLMSFCLVFGFWVLICSCKGCNYATKIYFCLMGFFISLILMRGLPEMGYFNAIFSCFIRFAYFGD